MSSRKRRRIRHSEMPPVEHAIFHALESADLARRGLFGTPQEAADDYACRRENDAAILTRLYLPEERRQAKRRQAGR